MMTSWRPKVDATAGFTLLEVLIGLVLMGVILTALSTISAQWLPNWNRGMTRLQGAEKLALGLDRLAADLSAAEFVSMGREHREPYFDGSERSIIFVRTAVGPHARSGLELIRIAEATTAQGAVLVRTRAAFAFHAGNGNQAVFENPVVLVHSPYRLTFSYAGADRVWRETWTRQARLPSAIKLNVHDHANSKRHSSLALLLHIGVPQRCIAAKSFQECLTLLQPQDGQSALLSDQGL